MKTSPFAKSLRRKETDAERKLWQNLRGRQLGGYKFRRQHSLGSPIADFYCPERKLVIELDGGQHLTESLKDAHRTKELNQMGCRVIRFWDHEVLQEIDAVLEAIRLHLSDPHPHPLPLRGRGGKKGRPKEDGRILPWRLRKREVFIL